MPAGITSSSRQDCILYLVSVAEVNMQWNRSMLYMYNICHLSSKKRHEMYSFIINEHPSYEGLVGGVGIKKSLIIKILAL